MVLSGDPGLRSTVRQLEDLLQAEGEQFWSRKLRRARIELETGPRPEVIRGIALRLLGMFGGMGSFNDLVLYDESGIRPSQDQFDDLRHRLYELLVEARAGR